MSDAPHSPHDVDDGPHEGPVKTVKQLIAAVLFAFVIPIAVIVLLVSRVDADNRPAAGSDGLSAAAVAQRIHPVASVEIKDVSDVAAMKTGEQVYAGQCITCHGSGAAGAPKVGDTAAWAPRIVKGFDALFTSAYKGKGAMGAQGGGDFTDLEIARAVTFLANKGGAKFAEPQASAASAVASAGAASAAQ